MSVFKETNYHKSLLWQYQNLPALLSQEGLKKHITSMCPFEKNFATLFELLPIDAEPPKAGNEINKSTLHPLSPDNRRLGKYYERIVNETITSQGHYKKVFQNVQIPGYETAGELDFVLFDGQSVTHLEIAIKFYLYVPGQEASLAQFVGPGLNDRFDLKLSKLLNRQLQHKVPWAALGCDFAANENMIIERKLLLTGMLFYPWANFAKPTSIDAERYGLNPKHGCGWWMTQSTFTQQLETSVFFSLPKSLWLTPDLQTAEYFLNQIGETPTPLTPATLKSNEPTFCIRCDQQQRILDRGFVVPDEYLPVNFKTRHHLRL